MAWMTKHDPVARRRSPARRPIRRNAAWAASLMALTGSFLFIGQVLSGGSAGRFNRLMNAGAAGTVVLALAYALDLLDTRAIGAIVTVLGPVVALAVSTAVENYQWSIAAALGLVAVLAGNVLVLRPVKKQD